MTEKMDKSSHIATDVLPLDDTVDQPDSTDDVLCPGIQHRTVSKN